MTIDRNQIRARAEQLLKDSHVSEEPIPVASLARAAGVTLRVGALPDEMSGFLLHHKEGTILGVNGAHSRVRQNFTIAHELGHLLLHTDQSFVDRSFPVFFRDERSATAEERSEIEANSFAAELLMPEARIRKILRKQVIDIDDETVIRMLARRFAVSPQAMSFRLLNLGLAQQ